MKTIAKTGLQASLAMLVAAASGVNAVEINPDGVGQVLIYPYYTVNANNTTLFSVVNTKNHVKVVKIRFMEGYNGQEVLDFNLFLSAHDVWTAGIFSFGTLDGGNLLTDDESCTIPDIKGATGSGISQLPAPDGRSYAPFRNGQYQTDGGPKTIDRSREGHIEVIELASIAAGSPIENAVNHLDGVPPGCTGLTAIVQSHVVDLLAPKGGLFGSVNIVNPALGTLIGYNADAIDAFFLLDSNLYFGEGPTLASGRTTATTAVAYNYAATTSDGPGNRIASTYSGQNAIDAVSAIFAASAITNEYVIEANSASESEWVINFPTKKYYVNSTPPIAPFIRRFSDPGRSCVAVGLDYFDREERTVQIGNDLGDPVLPTLLCYETQVVTFQTASSYAAGGGVSSVLGSRLTVDIDPRGDGGFSSGWLRLDMSPVASSGNIGEAHALRPSMDLDVFHGLPVTGFLATNYLNRNNGGPNVLSTYSTGSRHRVSRSCTNATTGGTGFCS